jgi:predicted lipoprotein with Yx(FWY)xxD motif
MNRLLVMLSLLVGVVAASGMTGCGGDGDKQVTLGDQTFTEKGTKDASGMASLEIEADNFYFEPTFVRGTAGQRLTLQVTNDSSTLHNISVPALLIDKDIAANSNAEVDVTLPQSGVLLFICKLHTAQGMNGELLVGDAQPQAASAAVAAPTVKLRDAGQLGQILVDNAGRTLYLYTNDVVGSGRSAVTGTLAVAWPPLTLAGGEPLKTPDLPGELTLITRDDGTKQVAYKGMPLYYFAQDTATGDINGQARGNVWYVLSP